MLPICYFSDWRQCNFDAWFFSPPFKSQCRNICMKECPVGNKVFYSYYSKQNYFNLRANTILHQHDPISPPLYDGVTTQILSVNMNWTTKIHRIHARRASDSTAAISACIQMENKHALAYSSSSEHWILLCQRWLYDKEWLGEMQDDTAFYHKKKKKEWKWDAFSLNLHFQITFRGLFLGFTVRSKSHNISAVCQQVTKLDTFFLPTENHQTNSIKSPGFSRNISTADKRFYSSAWAQ